MGIRYVAGYTTQLPARLRISFICEYCGHINEIIRTKTFKGRDVGGFLFPGTIEGARKELISDLKHTQENISSNRYQELELSCQCEACKRKPIWSSFRKTPLTSCLVAFVISLLIAICVIDAEVWPVIIICIVICVAAIVTVCYFEIYNSKIKKKCDRTNREFLPFISIEPLNTNDRNNSDHNRINTFYARDVSNNTTSIVNQQTATAGKLNKTDNTNASPVVSQLSVHDQVHKESVPDNHPENKTCKCPKCGAMIPVDSKFCGFCGETITKAVFCRKCGSKLLQGATFCSNCGERTV